MNKVYIVLDSGQTFSGEGFGAKREAVGELVFTTGMTGYVETLTDPSYYGQIILQTFPLIGNCGIIPDDFESEGVFASAYIVREHCEVPSNFRSKGTLDAFLKERNIPGVGGVDTRELTKIIRERGSVNACITDEAGLASAQQRAAAYKLTSAVQVVTCEAPMTHSAENARHSVVLWDFGAKLKIRRELNRLGCNVTEVPAHWSAEQIMALRPDGIVLSNGPGDPAENSDIIAEIKKLIGRAPMFGICLGHQLLALAHGAKTAKLRYGHRGANQPVRSQSQGRVYITGQNHGYEVLTETLPKSVARESFTNVNDGSCEGIDYLNSPAFSVQFHPEACGGPHDTRFLFERFITLMEGAKNAAE